MNVPQSS